MEKTNTPWSFIHFFRGFFPYTEYHLSGMNEIKKTENSEIQWKNNKKKKKNISFRHVTGQLSIVNSRISETKTKIKNKKIIIAHTHTNINIINKTFFSRSDLIYFERKTKTKSKNVTFDTDCLFCFGFVRVFTVFTYSFPV